MFKPFMTRTKWLSRTMFNIYFKEYSEKVWGIDCSRIGQDWVSKRISGLSLGTAIKNAFFKLNSRNIPTLIDNFVYPKKGIGRISDRLKDEIQKTNQVLTDTGVVRITHNGQMITGATVKHRGATHNVNADAYVSSIPVTSFVKMLDPEPSKSGGKGVGEIAKTPSKAAWAATSRWKRPTLSS